VSRVGQQHGVTTLHVTEELDLATTPALRAAVADTTLLLVGPRPILRRVMDLVGPRDLLRCAPLPHPRRASRAPR
jgi:hypothetical protein